MCAHELFTNRYNFLNFLFFKQLWWLQFGYSLLVEVLDIQDFKLEVILFGHTVRYISFLTDSVQVWESVGVMNTCET